MSPRLTSVYQVTAVYLSIRQKCLLQSGQSATGPMECGYQEGKGSLLDVKCSPYRDRPRTLDVLLDHLIAWFAANPAASFEVGSGLSDKHISGEIDLRKGNRAA
jgi:hypothetical protein